MPHQNVGQKKKAKEIVFPLSVAKMKVLLIGSRKKKKVIKQIPLSVAHIYPNGVN